MTPLFLSLSIIGCVGLIMASIIQLIEYGCRKMEQQPDLLDWIERNPKRYENPTFDGSTIEPEDGARLQQQLARVYAVMRDGEWRTLKRISELTDDPEPSVSARLRDLRKPKFGGYTVMREQVKDQDGKPIPGLFAYRLVHADAGTSASAGESHPTDNAEAA